VERLVLDDALVAGDDDLPEQARRLGVVVHARVRRGEDGLEPDRFLGVLKEVGHALRAFDNRECLLGLADHVVRRGEVSEPHELI